MSKLSTAERLILTNQYKLLNAAGMPEAGQHDDLITILEAGYELQINEFLERAESEAMSESECRFVLNVMDMFDILHTSWQQLDEVEQHEIAEWRVTFGGFDGEHERKYLDYVLYLVDIENCWAHFPREDNFNAHRPMLDRYKTLLKNFDAKQLSDKYTLSFEQLSEVLNQAL